MSTKRTTTRRKHQQAAIRGRSLFFGRIAAHLLIFSFLLQPLTFVYADEATEAPVVESASEPEPEPRVAEAEPDPEPEPEPTPDAEPSDSEASEAAEDQDDQTTNDNDGAEKVVVTTDVEGDTEPKEDVSGSDEDTTNEAVNEDVTDADDGSTKETNTKSGAESTTTSTTTDPLTDPDELLSERSTDPVTDNGTATGTASSTQDQSETQTAATSSTTTSPTTGGGATDDEKATTTDEATTATTTVSTTTTTVKDVQKEPETTQSATSSPTEIENQADDTSTTTATTTDEIGSEPEPMVAVVYNDENKHQFSKDECVLVGDGSYYCSKGSVTSAPEEDAVFARADEDGDREIFVVIDGSERQITDDSYDDTSPYYDTVSDRIVWHTLRNGRYQIASHDLKTGETALLTDTPYNNMEPTAFGDVTLWQAWIDGSWEIVMDDAGEQTQLTDNDTHDVAPHAKDEYIVWQTQYEDGWYVSVYDRKTKEIEVIEGDGSRILNPRFVLVYDSLNESGDIETLGYDLRTKQVVPLSSTPAPVPTSIPEPDTTGEERALIQSKPTLKDETEMDGEGGDDSGDSVGTTTHKTGDIDMSSASSTDTMHEDVESEYDVVIEASGTKNATSTHAHIDDLVIPSIASSTLPQDDVASTSASGDNNE